MKKKVFKYGTGQEIPMNAKYLCTQVETQTQTVGGGIATQTINVLVWHYYEVYDE